MPSSYPQEVHDFVKKWTPDMTDEVLARECNKAFGTSFTASSMKSFRGNHGYRYGRKKRRGADFWKYQTCYPEGMYEFVRDNSSGVSSARMAEMVNERFGTAYTPSGMKQFRQRFGIVSGLTGQYEKGRVSERKGRKLEEVLSPESAAAVRRGMVRAQFHKGHRPQNERPVGAIVVNSEGYKLRKVSMTGTQRERWEFLHRLVWTEHNGPIPDGMIVSFKNGDRLDCSIENLMLVTKQEHSALNMKGYRSEDPELTETAVNLIRLQRAARERRKKRNEDTGRSNTARDGRGVQEREEGAEAVPEPGDDRAQDLHGVRCGSPAAGGMAEGAEDEEKSRWQ